MESIRFKRQNEGEYNATIKQPFARVRNIEISKNYDSRTWSVSIYDQFNSHIWSDCFNTYADCKSAAASEINREFKTDYKENY